MTRLAEKRCVPCRGGTPPLGPSQIEPLHREVDTWEVVRNHHIRHTFPFPDFKRALEFVNQVGHIAEQEDHHPDIFLAWGEVEITIWTHKIDGLSESDFVLAAKIDGINQEDHLS